MESSTSKIKPLRQIQDTQVIKEMLSQVNKIIGITSKANSFQTKGQSSLIKVKVVTLVWE